MGIAGVHYLRKSTSEQLSRATILKQLPPAQYRKIKKVHGRN